MGSITSTPESSPFAFLQLGPEGTDLVFVNEMLSKCVSVARFWLPLPPSPFRPLWPFLVLSLLPAHLRCWVTQ